MLDPGAGDNPGTGTSTLEVDADINARPLLPNASNDADFTTEFHVRVQKGNVDVTTGTVTIRSAGGEVALAYSSNNRWNGAQVGYFEVYELNVVSGTDKVEEVRVDGPALHSFTAPLAGATLDSTVPIQIKWNRGEQADVATIDTDLIDNLVIPDTGTFSLPAGSLKSKTDATEQERIRLDREQRVTPTGAVVGSVMRVSIHNEIEVLVQPTGL